jgi:hypothetical protein
MGFLTFLKTFSELLTENFKIPFLAAYKFIAINYKSTTQPWWDVYCIRLESERMAFFREFRYQGAQKIMKKLV